MKDKTLNEILTDNGYTHSKSEIDGKQNVFKDGELIGCFNSSQAWEFVYEEIYDNEMIEHESNYTEED